MNDVVVLGITRDDIVALGLLIADGFLCVVNIILLLLGNLFWLLLALLLMKHCKTSFLSLDLCKDWLQAFGGISFNKKNYMETIYSGISTLTDCYYLRPRELMISAQYSF